MTAPPKLRRGDTVALISPAGPCKPHKIDQAVNALKNIGLRTVVMNSKKHGYLADTDSQRAKNIMHAFLDPRIKGIFAARGGYGTQRLLPLLDYKLIGKNPKIFVGYSDITALHVAFNQHAKLITYHAPMPATELCHPDIDSYTINSFLGHIMKDALPAPKLTFTTLIQGDAKGILTGGNLSLLASSLGTPYEIDTTNKILFMEDIDEEPYKIDRMLVQLQQSGKLNECQAIILGSFSPQTPETLSQAINEILIPLGKPLGVNLPCGHCLPTATLPLGEEVCFDFF